MALTTTEENQLRELLRRSSATQEGKTASELGTWTSAQPGQWFISSVGDRIYRVSGHEVATMTTLANVTGSNARTASNTVNHLMSRDATRNEIARITAPAITEAKAVGQAAQATANNVQQYAQNMHAIINDHDGKINTLRNEMPKRLQGWKDNLVMDFGSLPPGTGAVTVTFNKRFKGHPIVMVNFWGDIGNPRFTLAQDGNETWGIRLSANYPGVWAVIGEPA
jgi:hypothetical protein